MYMYCIFVYKENLMQIITSSQESFKAVTTPHCTVSLHVTVNKI